MKPYVALLLATTLAAAPALAQGQYGRGPGRRMEGLLRDITLTAQQQAKVDSIRGHYREQMPSFTPGSPPDSATREKVRGMFRHQVDDIRAVLTADQQKIFDRNVAAMRERRGGGGGGGPAD
jgi:Spy/CpxP family protein refolding chaperone